MTTDDLFWSKVDKGGDCWLWTGYAKNGYGIGARRLDGAARKIMAHRYSLMLSGVEIDGFQVDHICHTRACVRPEHLRLVTNKQNLEHRAGANRNSSTGVRGVRRDSRSSRWIAEVRHNNVSHSRRFDDFDDACAYVLELRNNLFTHNTADQSAA